MSLVLAVDGKNDLYVGANGSLATVAGLDAVMQAAQQAAQTQLGEMLYAVDQGVPNFATVWNGAPNVPQFGAFLRRTLLAVENVTGVESVEVTRSGNVLTYVARIQTIYGTGEIASV
jgi:hypothetical protein